VTMRAYVNLPFTVALDDFDHVGCGELRTSGAQHSR
jgi:hypothetical protein